MSSKRQRSPNTREQKEYEALRQLVLGSRNGSTVFKTHLLILELLDNFNIRGCEEHCGDLRTALVAWVQENQECQR